MYQNLSRYYDFIFPAGQAQMNFFERVFRKSNTASVLDVACGSGSYTIWFAQRGLRATGIDNEESLIRLAREKAAGAGVEVAFYVDDMRTMSMVKDTHDAAICIGNSLVHLLDPGDLNMCIKRMYRALRPGGSLIIQTVNYDRIMAGRPAFLPDIINEKEGIRFTRHYKYLDNGLITFTTSLSRLKGENAETLHEGSVSLRPLSARELKDILINAGFDNLEFYGSFKGEPRTGDSPATVVKALK